MIKKNKYLFLLLIPGLVYYIFFRYYPIYGLQLAFKEFDVSRGITGSPFVGFKYFQRLFETREIGRVIFNTVYISFLRILVGFPAPIIFALLLNEVRQSGFKRTVQTISYMPHFLSWVIVSGLFIEVLSPSRGLVAYLANLLHVEAPYLMISKTWIIPILIFSSLWKEVGYSTILYLATISNISPELYEAAIVDGAGRLKQARYITIPGILPIITILLIMNTGSILNGGFDQIYNMTNDMVSEKVAILDTYIYKVGLEGFEYSFTTAVGLVKNVVAFAMVFITNSIVRRYSEYAIW